jgi:membrane-bound metal-dependent hydrolase YbcI (DUF457 family)
VEPVTHALTSLALARAGQRQLPRYGTAILLVAGVAPELDYASYFGGAGAFLRLDRSVLHSIAGGAVAACATAGAFWAVHNRSSRDTAARSPLRFSAALLVAVIGVTGNVLLDLASGTGVQLLWPFHIHKYAWNLLANLDPWILILLLAGLLLPELLRLVSEEIGERQKRVRGRTAAILVLSAIAAYVGARAVLHREAMDLLTSRDYHGQSPLSAAAFPSSTSPVEWRGVVATRDTIEEAHVPLGPGAEFDAERTATHYKPEDSTALDVGERAEATEMYLEYARFPLARVSRLEDGYRIEVHDLQFPLEDRNPANTFARVDVDSRLHVVQQQILFVSSPNP